MTTQGALFQQTQYGREQPHAGGEDTRDASYAAIQKQLGAKQRQYLGLMREVTRRGYQTKRGPVVQALTDAEAAALLGWPRSSVCGRRNELSGGSGAAPGTKAQPLIVKAGTRTCFVTGSTATAWRTTPGLFD